MSFINLYFCATNAPECKKMHLNSPYPLLDLSLWATKDDFGLLKKNILVAQIKFLGHWPKTLSVQHCTIHIL